MRVWLTWLCFGLVGVGLSGQQNAPPAPPPPGLGVLKRFEYKYSFKPPYLAQKDGSVPFFEYSGNAIASEESVRITPSLRSQKGQIWSKLMTNFDWWEVELHFRVTGRGRIGADGLAFWYTANKGVEGPVFGSSDRWNGLGIFFDSFDNDNKHNNPYIMAIVNDGTKAYDHQNDGSTQQLAGCLRDFRNKPFPVKAKIEYFNNILTVLFHNGMSNNDRDYEVCLRVENVILPKYGYFGVSAATGGLADDHDVLKFSTSSLRTPGVGTVPDVQDAESQKFEAEFEQYQKKLQGQKDQWAKEHPDQVMKNEDGWDNWFSDQDKELQQIFQGQSEMKNVLSDLHRKMDEIIGRQERTLSMMSGIQWTKVFYKNVPKRMKSINAQLCAFVYWFPLKWGIPVDTIRRDEVNAVLANQREIVSASRDIKNFVIDIHTKTGQLMSRGSAQPVGGPAATGGSDVSGMMQEMRESLNLIRRDLAGTQQRLTQNTPLKCPEVASGPTNCVSTSMFMVLMAVQLVIIIAYLMFRDSRETQAKKFY
ncbi:hypothetical protein TCAL_12897 [Tigriopus californicus]|uniref:L-type lectin-like domain-containing protein n=1 Tax=Tigriopus californicus TaxID=6832 RepID=A0A553NTR5_TIGCA|nr:hypothetical protein TCAL_12897 [Tigriopus californicus]